MNNPEQIRKDKSIMMMLAEVQRRLGLDSFQVVDHWDADLRAIGIAHPQDEHVLAYIAASTPEGCYYVELETAPAADRELPYAVAGRFHGATLDQVVELVASHFRGVTP